MELIGGLSSGALKYRLGLSYKECTSAAELNQWTTEERRSKCGFLHKHWNQMGNSAGQQLLSTSDTMNEEVVGVFRCDVTHKEDLRVN